MQTSSKLPLYAALLVANMVYSFEPVFVKLASQHGFLSLPYIVYIASAVAVLGVYAVIWQQIIKRLPVSEAYMFKGTVLIFVLLLSVLMFGETITWNNVIGAAMIITGIILFSKA